MTSKGNLADRLTQVDGLNRPDHHYLQEGDVCLYLGEYTARKGYAHSETNHLVVNFKKGVDRKGLPEWKYKGIAIRKAGGLLRQALTQDALQKATHVPIPPSKAKSDPQYDDRVLQMVRVCAGPSADIRELVVQNFSTGASHESDSRPSPGDLVANYSIDQSLITPAPKLLLVYDDVLTTGAHFKAVQYMLRQAFPDVPIFGLFIARRVPESDDFDIIEQS
jgi:hypothetical protein